MSNPKEKARDLVIKFYPIWYDNGTSAKTHYAKEFALIAVEEIIKEAGNDTIHLYRNGLSDNEYWQQVKQDIQNL